MILAFCLIELQSHWRHGRPIFIAAKACAQTKLIPPREDIEALSIASNQASTELDHRDQVSGDQIYLSSWRA